ncbi:MAG: homocysteine S-methyltransferase family protein [Lachnospiraceae bacterium]|jgi:5-methyltetrahydrofolate--homocysteine methyltransferase
MSKLTILDGAMGTMLQTAGLPLGMRPEIFGLENPQVVEDIHRKYIESGSNIICSNTFGANSKKLTGTGVEVSRAVAGNVAIAKRAAGKEVRVALDIGPIGELMEPIGTLTFDDAYTIFLEIIKAGEEAGADLIFFETMSDLGELRAGILAAAENSRLPVWVSMSFEAGGRTFAGTLAASYARTMEGLPVEVVGINCSLGPKEILPIASEIMKYTTKPLLIKPNAGLPDPVTGAYTLDADNFGKYMAAYPEMGINILGGCCGTTPDYISEVFRLSRRPGFAERKFIPGVCSTSKVVDFDGVCPVGERLNPTGKKRLSRAIIENDLNYIMKCAIEQEEAGAEILDVNVGLPEIDEAQMMERTVRAVAGITCLPLQIDSADPKAIEAGLRVFPGKAIVNSVNAEDEVLDVVLPLVKKYGAAVVGLTMDKSGIPQSAEERLEMAEKILSRALAAGIPRHDVIIDCLALTISARPQQAEETLKAVRTVREELGLSCTLGVSNISYGLPKRKALTGTFLAQALSAGLNLPIIDPNLPEIMDIIAAHRALSGMDEGCRKYIERFSGRDAATAPDRIGLTLEEAVLKGLGEEVRTIIQDLLETMTELEVIDKKLIPALDRAGGLYERQEFFLPQLISSATAAGCGFEVIKERIASRGEKGAGKGKMILATVEGDIHDIGKNIVKVVLENYGYDIIDLGKDVPPDEVAACAEKENVKMVGLSALMTTTIPSMRKTIEKLRAGKMPCKVMVGGAVLTAEAAAAIGADYYAKDARQAAIIAGKVFGQKHGHQKNN